jgi:hypothetical protein
MVLPHLEYITHLTDFGALRNSLKSSAGRVTFLDSSIFAPITHYLAETPPLEWDLSTLNLHRLWYAELASLVASPFVRLSESVKGNLLQLFNVAQITCYGYEFTGLDPFRESVSDLLSSLEVAPSYSSDQAIFEDYLKRMRSNHPHFVRGCAPSSRRMICDVLEFGEGQALLATRDNKQIRLARATSLMMDEPLEMIVYNPVKAQFVPDVPTPVLI